MRKPSGAIRCSRDPVTAQSRATLPVLGGIFGWTRTTLSRASAGSRNSVCGAGMAGIAIIANPNARRNREWPLAAQQLRKAAPGAPLLETRNADELAKAARALARTLASSLTLGPFARRLYAPMDLRIRLDDDEWPPVPIYGLVCSSVAEAGLGLRPFRRATEQPGAFQALGLTAGPRQFALELPRLLVGLPARRDRLLEGVGEKLELSGRAPLSWLLDGEIYSSKSGKLAVGLGPRVSLVRA